MENRWVTLKNQLSKMVDFWRKKNSEGVVFAAYYVDAYLSVLSNMEALEKETTE